MERQLAEKIGEQLDRLASELNILAHTIEEIADESERKNFRRLTARLMTGEYADLCTAVGQQFPDLNPLVRRSKFL